MESVKREDIATQVIAKIAGVANFNEKIQESDRLFEKLRMGPSLRRSLALSFSRIARAQNGGKPISGNEAEGLHTVGESIDLVFRRASGKD